MIQNMSKPRRASTELRRCEEPTTWVSGLTDLLGSMMVFPVMSWAGRPRVARLSSAIKHEHTPADRAVHPRLLHWTGGEVHGRPALGGWVSYTPWRFHAHPGW